MTLSEIDVVVASTLGRLAVVNDGLFDALQPHPCSGQLGKTNESLLAEIENHFNFGSIVLI